MVRYARIDIPEKYYHIYSRGQDKNNLFTNVKDYFTFLNYLDEYVKKSDIELNAYCLMPNHFHLLVYQRQDSISDFMHKLLTRYSLYFNETHDHVGHVFQGRFKSKIITNKKYLKNLVYYIHHNPVRAGILGKEDQYPYSSSHFYSGGYPKIKIKKIWSLKTDYKGNKYRCKKDIITKDSLEIFDNYIGKKDEFLKFEKRKPGRNKSKFHKRRNHKIMNIEEALEKLYPNCKTYLTKKSYHLGPQKRKMIIKLYKLGYSQSSIARVFQCHPSSIGYIVKNIKTF